MISVKQKAHNVHFHLDKVQQQVKSICVVRVIVDLKKGLEIRAQRVCQSVGYTGVGTW